MTQTTSPNGDRKAPVNLEQAAAMLRKLAQGSLSVDVGIRAATVAGVEIPAGSRLHFELAFRDGRIDAEKTAARLTDRAGDGVILRKFFFRLDRVVLRQPKGQESANLIAIGRLGFIPVQRTLARGLPLEIVGLLEKLAGLDGGNGGGSAGAGEGKFDAGDYHYQLGFQLDSGSTLKLNEGTSIRVGEEGSAAVGVDGVRDYSVATVTGAGVALETSLFSTASSDLDVKITLDRREGGVHQVAFDDTTLRQVHFKSPDFDAPTIETLKIVATDAPDGGKTYDFVITLDPANAFTIQDLIANVTARVGDPDAVAKFRQKLAGGTDETGSPGEIILDSARWNIADYVSHDLKGQFAGVKDLPHIREHLNDPAIALLAEEGADHMRGLVLATHLQLASAYLPERLSELARLVLSDPLRQALAAVDPGGEIEGLEQRLGAMEGEGDWSAAKDVERIIRNLGHRLNAIERGWLRESWVAAGGLESEGRAYALIVHFTEALLENIGKDPNAPIALKMKVAGIPRGEELERRVAIAADNVRGAIWAALGVLRDGWKPVSERLESVMRDLYGAREEIGGAAFLAQSRESEGEEFQPCEMRHLGDGEEFFLQYLKLLDDCAAAGAETGPIALNYWTIQSSRDPATGAPDVWGMKIAEKLRELALAGFTVSIVVDEKNGPSRRGQQRLAEIAAEVAANGGGGSFHLSPWLPEPDRFPLGTHVKYLVTPVGVIAGGSNLGDHYSHWSDTNILLRGKEVVEHFWAMHLDVLREQEAVGQRVPVLPPMEPADPDLWRPLDHYESHGHEREVFDSEWSGERMRTYRDQGGDQDDRILVEIIAALDLARGADSGRPDTVFIANAYFVLTQPIAEHPVARAVGRAIERGVNVEILTNSADSSDEPAVAGPIVKSAFLILAMARDQRKAADDDGRQVGQLTMHLPDAEFIDKDDAGIPKITIHDKIMFFANMSFVATVNLHPRSFTLEQELLTELIGTDEPSRGTAHTDFLARARDFLEHLRTRRGGDRITDVDALLAPLEWNGDAPPMLWDSSAWHYLLWLEKRFAYCKSFTSATDEEVAQLGAKLDESSQASLADLMMNIF